MRDSTRWNLSVKSREDRIRGGSEEAEWLVSRARHSSTSALWKKRKDLLYLHLVPKSLLTLFGCTHSGPTRDWIIAPIDASQSITHEKSIEQVAAKDDGCSRWRFQSFVPPQIDNWEAKLTSSRWLFFIRKIFIYVYFLSFASLKKRKKKSIVLISQFS